MFTCPEKDIHSIYIDGELPVEYKAKYEAHVQSCKKCQAELARLQKLRSFFQKDSKNLDMKESSFDESFEKLQGRLSFRRVTSFAQEPRKFSVAKFMIPTAAAAAAVFALIIPLRVQDTQVQKMDTELTPMVSKASIAEKPIADSNILVSGNISNESLEKMAEHNEQNQKKAPSETISSYSDVLSSTVHYLGNASNMANRRLQKMSEALAAIDVFHPDFDDSQTARISITIPSAVNIPVSIENLEQPEK